ncbi:MAG: hypothetical protein QM791_20285 [Ferruginibacter sp.]
MSAQQIQSTLLTWINSCRNESQLVLCQHAVDNLFTKRFRHHHSWLFAKMETELAVSLVEKRKQLP